MHINYKLESSESWSYILRSLLIDYPGFESLTILDRILIADDPASWECMKGEWVSKATKSKTPDTSTETTKPPDKRSK